MAPEFQNAMTDSRLNLGFHSVPRCNDDSTVLGLRLYALSAGHSAECGVCEKTGDKDRVGRNKKIGRVKGSVQDMV